MKLSINYKPNLINSDQFSKYKKELKNIFFTSKVFSCIAIATALGFVVYGATSLYGRIKKKENISPEVKELQPKLLNTENSSIESTQPIDEPIDFQNQPIKLSSNQLIEIIDFPFFEEDNYIYKDSLEIEISKIHEHLSIPENKAILDYIKQKKNQDAACAILWVILGIKPVAVFETNLNEELRSLIRNVLKLNVYKDNLKFIDNHQKFPKYYFINEKPLEIFNPRRYLTKLLPYKQTNSITEAVTYCFPNQGYPQTDQILSYLLGFGPSWEAYTVNASRFPRYSILNPIIDLSFSCFSDEHYFEIGKVLNSLILKTDPSNEINLGKVYHKELPNLAKSLTLKKNSWLEDQIKCDNDLGNFKNTGIHFVFDRITSETDYFKKSYTLRTWVFQIWLPNIRIDS